MHVWAHYVPPCVYYCLSIFSSVALVVTRTSHYCIVSSLNTHWNEPLNLRNQIVIDNQYNVCYLITLFYLRTSYYVLAQK